MSSSSQEKYLGLSIPRFDGYYDHWAMMMENFIRSKEYWNLIEEGLPVVPRGAAGAAAEAQRKALDEAKLKDMKIKNYLFQSIDREIMETILDKSTSKAIWDSMKQKFQGSTRVRRAQLQALRREFEVLQMKEIEGVDAYLARTLKIANKMKMHGEILTQVVLIKKYCVQ